MCSVAAVVVEDSKKTDCNLMEAQLVLRDWLAKEHNWETVALVAVIVAAAVVGKIVAGRIELHYWTIHKSRN